MPILVNSEGVQENTHLRTKWKTEEVYCKRKISKLHSLKSKHFSPTLFCKLYLLSKTEIVNFIIWGPNALPKRERYLYPQHIFSGDIKCSRLQNWKLLPCTEVPQLLEMCLCPALRLTGKAKLSSIKWITQVNDWSFNTGLNSTLCICKWQ